MPVFVSLCYCVTVLLCYCVPVFVSLGVLGASAGVCVLLCWGFSVSSLVCGCLVDLACCVRCLVLIGGHYLTAVRRSLLYSSCVM